MLCPPIGTTSSTAITAQKVFLPGIWILYGVSITLQEFEWLSTVGRNSPVSIAVGEKRKRTKVGEEKEEATVSPIDSIDNHNDDKTRAVKRIKPNNEDDKVKAIGNSVNASKEAIEYDTLTPLQTIAEQDQDFISRVPQSPYFVQRYKNGKADEDVYFLQLFSDLLFHDYNRVPLEKMRNVIALSMDYTLQHFDQFVRHHLGDDRKAGLFSMLEVYEQSDSINQST